MAAQARPLAQSITALRETGKEEDIQELMNHKDGANLQRQRHFLWLNGQRPKALNFALFFYSLLRLARDIFWLQQFSR